MKKPLLLTLSLLSYLLVAGAASAQTPPPGAPPSIVESVGSSPGIGDSAISAWLILPWYSGFGYGIGARYMLPLPITPLLSHTRLRDSWALEFGADILHWSCGVPGYDCGWTEVLPVVGMMWNVGINSNFTVYPKIEAGYPFGWYSGGTFAGRSTYSTVFVSGGAGLMYRLNNGITLRAELGYAGLKGGIAWLF